MLRAGEASLSEDLVIILLCLLFLIDLRGLLINICLDQFKALEGANGDHNLNDFWAVSYVVLHKVFKQVVLFLGLKPKIFKWRYFLFRGCYPLVFFFLFNLTLLASEVDVAKWSVYNHGYALEGEEVLLLFDYQVL